EASVITNPAAGAAKEGVMGAGMEQQAGPPAIAELTSLGLARVSVQSRVDDTLSELSIEGLPDFGLEPDVYEYDIEVPSDMKELVLDAVPTDERASVDISDTALETGENTVTVTVSTGVEAVQYFLHVTRPETELLPEMAPEQEAVSEPETVSAPKAALESGTEGERPEEDNPQTIAETESLFVPAMAQPAADPGWPAGHLASFAVRYLYMGGGVLLLLAAAGLGIFLWRRKREEPYFDEDEDDMEWIELDTDGNWRRWQEAVDETEEEMEEADSRPREKQQEPPVIRVEDVSMRFKISDINAGSLKEYLLVTLKRQNRYHELEALRHISFDIRRGEVIGIIGTNGSGKSTLLKLIAGVLKPSEGRVEVDKKKVQLLTLGTGFDAELTARENVYLNGAIIGYSREFIDENFDRIVAFAELEGFMDEKIKNFSSGMTSRLGFAIATVGETADILILDEVLSVGDMFFRQKSEQRIKEMIHGGSTVLIVSHSTDTIIKNCTRAVWIEKGVLKEIGEPKKVCEAYRKLAG
ncbi:MAG TPA: ATP-binding cassette domain-containing protein, partial [Candidatus Eisenbergiella stercorigallinarum]|nr:ATP-binding cassette domain-containing protein [Candidatus Eisenbergiella stercorigallinarum]